MKNVLSTTVGAFALFVLAGCAAEQQAGSDPRMQLAAARVVVEEGCTLPQPPLGNLGLQYQVTGTGTSNGPQPVPIGKIDSCGRFTFSFTEGDAVPHDGLTPGRNIDVGHQFRHRVTVGGNTRTTSCTVRAEAEPVIVPAGTFVGLVRVQCTDQRTDRPLPRHTNTWVDPRTRVIIRQTQQWHGPQPGSRDIQLLERPAVLRPTS
jgi:hypothetical protein